MQKRRLKNQKHFKEPIIRRCTIITSSSEEETDETFNNRIYLTAAIKNDIVIKLEQKLMDIQNVGYFPKQLKFGFTTPDTPNIDNSKASLQNLLINFNPDHVETLRVIINFSAKGLNSEYDTKGLNNNGISHLVEIIIQEGGISDNLSKDNFITRVIVKYSKPQIINILLDTLLDISMYHTFITPHISTDSFDHKHSFSYFKVEFAAKNNIQAKPWDSEAKGNYLSLASSCWEKKGFNCKKYVELWDKLSNEYLVSISKSVNFKPITLQLKSHPFYGELSISSILKKLNNQKTGTYLLLRTEKRPNSKKQIREIKIYFPDMDEKKWHKGIIAIAKPEKLMLLKRYEKWISIFKIINA